MPTPSKRARSRKDYVELVVYLKVPQWLDDGSVEETICGVIECMDQTPAGTIECDGADVRSRNAL